MNTSSDSFDRRRFLKGEIGDILNHTGLTNTFAQTNYGVHNVKKAGPDKGSSGQSIIRL